jgi:hypothetical protein
VIYAGLFYAARGSALIVALFHAASHTVGPFTGVEQAVVLVVVAAAVALFAGWVGPSARRSRPLTRTPQLN